MYHLTEDIGERNNLVDKLPDKTNELYKMLLQWREETGAVLPVENPDFDPILCDKKDTAIPCMN